MIVEIGIGIAALALLKKRSPAKSATLVARTAAPVAPRSLTLTRNMVANMTATGIEKPSTHPYDGKLPVPSLTANGTKITRWEQIHQLMKRTQDFRKKVDGLSSSSSFKSLAGGSAVSPAWKWDDVSSFANWWGRGGERHIKAVVERVKKTGGNESFWGGEGGARMIIELAGNIAGTVISGGSVTNAGTVAGDVYAAGVTVSYNGDTSAFVDKVATTTKNLLAR